MKIFITKREAVCIISGVYNASSFCDDAQSLKHIAGQIRRGFNFPEEVKNNNRFFKERQDCLERDPQLDEAIERASKEHPNFSWDRIAQVGRYSNFWETHSEYCIFPRETPKDEAERMEAARLIFYKLESDYLAKKESEINGEIVFVVI